MVAILESFRTCLIEKGVRKVFVDLRQGLLFKECGKLSEVGFLAVVLTVAIVGSKGWGEMSV